MPRPVGVTAPSVSAVEPIEEPSGPPFPVPGPRAPARPVVAPLSPERYRIEFTVGTPTKEKLRRVQELLRRKIPDGDPGAIFDYALTLVLREAEKKAFAATTQPKPARPTRPGSRTIPAAVRRAVWKRDGGRCAFVGRKGRCSERSFLEFHHRHPHAYGGAATVENIALRCRTHNVYESELVFGPFDPSVVRETSASYGRSARKSVPEQIGV